MGRVRKRTNSKLAMYIDIWLWLRGLKRRSASARLLRLRVRIPSEARVSVSWECCVLLGGVLCFGLMRGVLTSVTYLLTYLSYLLTYLHTLLTYLLTYVLIYSKKQSPSW